MKRPGIRNILRIIWASAGLLFLVWNWTTFQSWNLPPGTFQNDEAIRVTEDDDKYTFEPVTRTNSLEVIFLQGGMTDPKAYGPLCRKIAGNGFTCHLLKMPWRLPRYGYQEINKIFNLTANLYVIAGHSQGAMAAAQFVFENPGLMKGLIMMGTSHPKDIDLSGSTIPTLKLYAEHDGLASVGEVMENKSKLPRDAQLVLIEGGNHSQFGYLGHLLLDDDAAISLEAQQHITAQHMVAFLNGLEAQF
jgi:hypothetical protein